MAGLEKKLEDLDVIVGRVADRATSIEEATSLYAEGKQLLAEIEEDLAAMKKKVELIDMATGTKKEF